MELLEAVRTAIPDTTPWMIGAMLVVVAVLGLEADRRPPRAPARRRTSQFSLRLLSSDAQPVGSDRL